MTKVFGITLVLLSVTGGFLLGSGHVMPFLLLFFPVMFLTYRLIKKETPPLPSPSSLEKADDPPPFVKEEVLDGASDTSMRTLTPEYKKKIRHEIEEVILDTLNSLLDILKGVIPYHTAAIFRRGRSDLLYLF